MGFPPVLAGLLLLLLFWRAGPLGGLGLIFTPAAMVIAQVILATPIAAGVVSGSIRGLGMVPMEQLTALRLGRVARGMVAVREARAGVATAVAASFGRVVAEVGAVLVVGGNIVGETRVLTTLIVEESRQARFGAAVAAGAVLLVIALLVNVAVGRLMAEAMVAVKPEGKWAIIKGDAQMPIVDLFFSGQWQVVEPLVKSGDIEIVAEQYVENWKPDVAQTTMDQILTANNNEVDAVLTMNDGMAGGVVAALTAQGMEGIPVSGQDGDVAALNRIARGHQTVSVWKNSYELGRAAARASVALAGGADMLSVEGAVPYTTPSGATQAALLLEPIKVTRDNLNLVVDSDWIDRESLCQGVTENAPPACQ